jgi:hypothetical protein
VPTSKSPHPGVGVMDQFAKIKALYVVLVARLLRF